MRLDICQFIEQPRLEGLNFSASQWMLRKVTVMSRRVSTQQNLWTNFSPLYVLLREYFLYFLKRSFCIVSHGSNIKCLNKPDLIKLVLQLELKVNSNIKELTSEIRDLATQIKKVEADVAIVKNVNEKLVNQLIETERHCWANTQCSR